MAKDSFQDIVKIKVVKKADAMKQNSLHRSFKESDIINTNKEKISKNYNDYTYERNNPNHIGLWFVALISIVFLFFAVSFLFAGAKINIYPKTKNLDLNIDLTAVKNSSDENLSFDIVSLSGEEVKNVVAGEEKDYLENAKGKVVIYNAFNDKNQNFAINTRLEGSNGKIYKTLKGFTVPGVTKDGNPGSVEVDIYAASPGEEYNSAPIDFKILGFKGTPKYEKFYGRSVGEIIGGLKGKSRQINETDKNTAIEELKTKLLTKLFTKARDQIPTGFVLFKDSVVLKIDSIDIGKSDSEMVPISIKGTFYGFLFNEKKITKKIAESNIDKYDGSDIYISNIEDLVFNISDKENLDYKNIEDISFSLSGNANIVWKFDADAFLQEILGKSKREYSEILTKHTNIEKADLVIKPAWKNTIPEKEKAVKIIVNYPN